MRSARKEPNQRVCKASPEKTSGRGSAPARHAAKHAKKRSLFGRAKQEDPVPEKAAPAPQPEAAEEEHTYTAPAAPPSAIPPVEPVLTPPAPPKSVKRKLNVLQPASRPEAAAPQPRQLWIPPEQRCRKGMKAQKRPLRQKRSPPAAGVDPAVRDGSRCLHRSSVSSIRFLSGSCAKSFCGR